MQHHITFACAISLCLVTAVRADTIHVPRDHATIQTAIYAASDGDEIIIARGTYAENNINTFGKAITIRSVDPADPLVVYDTIIDGSNLDRVFVFNSGETADTVIDGLLVTRGETSSWGGGMWIDASSPTIQNCVIIENIATAGGAGVRNSGGAAPAFVNCTFIDNAASWIGGLIGSGGAVANSGSEPTFDNCVFRKNSAFFGGAIHSEGSPLTVTGCQFDDNYAERHGGAVYSMLSSPGTFTECAFRGNVAAGFAGSPDPDETAGGAIHTVSGSPSVIGDTLFCENTYEQITGDYTDDGGVHFMRFCPPPGACCLGDSCIIATQSDCAAAGGSYMGDGTTCAIADCPEPCLGDLNNDGAVDVSDLLLILSAWGACG